MSLINRMLRELSGREPQSGNITRGIQLPPSPRPRGGGGRRAIVLLVLVVVFTAVFWMLFRAAPPGPATDTHPDASITRVDAPRRFQLDDQLSPTPAATPPPRSLPPARPAELQLEPQLQGEPGVLQPPPRSRAETAIPASPVMVPPPPTRDTRAADARHAEAQRALTRGESRSAEQALRDALAFDPAHHAAREALVLLLLGQDRLVEAQSVLEDGLALAPERVTYRRLAARLDLARGQPGAAVARLETAPPTLASDPEYHGLLASAYQRLARHEEAARTYQSLMQLQPGEAHWWAGYALSRDALGDRAGALAAYAQARKLGQLDARVLEHINRRVAALQAAE